MYDKNYDEKELAYDLRQNFALITGEIKKNIVTARIEQDFPMWYSWLDCLFIEVSKNLSKNELTEYEVLKQNAIKVFSKNQKAYLKKTILNREKVYDALRKLDMWVNKIMNEKNMFGSKDLDEGL